jgi:alkanesulfonate monooxygenase SsuD/methylene tetrahydromethanopterin reductase-like flavin-dependent oxidoreductase (luciferase family)
MRERVEAMKEIWTTDEATYHGRHVDFERIWSWPKPLQKPHPPILVGGNGKTVYDRVVAYGDAWLPNYLGDVEKLVGRMGSLQRRAEESGRGPIPVTIYGAPLDAVACERFAEAGADRCVFWLPTAPVDDVMAHLERCEGVVADYGAAGG